LEPATPARRRVIDKVHSLSNQQRWPSPILIHRRARRTRPLPSNRSHHRHNRRSRVPRSRRESRGRSASDLISLAGTLTRSTCTRHTKRRRPNDFTARRIPHSPCRRQNLVSILQRADLPFVPRIANSCPAEVAQVRSSIVPLRSIQHKDAYGNPIGTNEE
jgi:hypothetical protein